MSVGHVGVQGGDIDGDKQEIGGKGGGDGAKMVKKWLESLMFEDRDWAMDWRWKSTKAEIRLVTG